MRVADLGGFAKAAEQLGLSTTTTSRLVAELETQLNARLLNRSTRKVSLTNTGERLLERYRLITTELDEAEQEAGDGRAKPQGMLRLTMPLTYGLALLAPVLAAFRKQYPEVELDVDMSDSRADLIDEGVDVALRIARDLTGSFVARRITPMAVVLCAAPDYLKRRGVPQTPDQLTAHACLLYTNNQPVNEWHLLGDDGRIVLRVAGPVRANNGELLRQCALAGDGIILQPTFLVERDLDEGRLVRILETFAPAPFHLFAVYQDRRHLPAKTRAFVDFIYGHFNSQETPLPAL